MVPGRPHVFTRRVERLPTVDKATSMILPVCAEFDAFSIYTDPALARLPPPNMYQPPTSFALQVKHGV